MAGFEPPREVAPPGRESVDPGLDGIEVATNLGRRELAAEVVLSHLLHANLGPTGVALASIEQRGAEHELILGEDVRLDDKRFARQTARGEAAAVDLGADILDDSQPQIEFEFGTCSVAGEYGGDV